MAGDPAEARLSAEQSREILAGTLDTHGLACTEIALSDIHLALGDADTARVHLDRGVARLSTSGDPRWRGKSMISLGRYRAATGDHEGAITAWRKALADLASVGAHEASQVRALLGES
jgi:predicted negative regulator of RcsB-dependent stress response